MFDDEAWRREHRRKWARQQLAAMPNTREYWLSCTTEERISAAELMRMAVFGHDPEKTVRVRRLDDDD
jgi:hypothetical protein